MIEPDCSGNDLWYADKQLKNIAWKKGHERVTQHIGQ